MKSYKPVISNFYKVDWDEMPGKSVKSYGMKEMLKSSSGRNRVKSSLNFVKGNPILQNSEFKQSFKIDLISKIKTQMQEKSN